jgi:hypothetical protein
MSNPNTWLVVTDWSRLGRDVDGGRTELSIHGETGRFRFLRYVYVPGQATAWIDVFGGPAGREVLRSFRPERVKTVHRKSKMRPE